MSDPTAQKAIRLYLHCRGCLENNEPSHNVEVGWTVEGLQVWCKQCDSNIVHIDFQGQQHPANVGEDQSYRDQILEFLKNKWHTSAQVSLAIQLPIEDTRKLLMKLARRGVLMEKWSSGVHVWRARRKKSIDR